MRHKRVINLTLSCLTKLQNGLQCFVGVFVNKIRLVSDRGGDGGVAILFLQHLNRNPVSGDIAEGVPGDMHGELFVNPGFRTDRQAKTFIRRTGSESDHALYLEPVIEIKRLEIRKNQIVFIVSEPPVRV